jgi:hypothetical protein
LSSTAGSAAGSAGCFLHRTRSIATQNLPDNPVRFVPERLPQPGNIRRARTGQLSSWKRWLVRVVFDVHWDRREVITSGVTSTPPAITTTMLHLCSAPCKALRFAPPALMRGLRALTVPARR